MKPIKKLKKVLALMLSLMMLLPLLTACGSEADPSAASQGDSQIAESSNVGDAADPTSEGSDLPAGIDWTVHETFTWWTNSRANNYYASYNDNPVVKYLEEKFNVTFEFTEPVAGTEVDSLALMFGTGQYTDIVAMNQFQSNREELHEDGVIIDIAEYLDYMPNLRMRMDADPAYNSHLYNDAGQFWHVDGYTEENRKSSYGLVYRRDILETMTGGNVQFPSGSDEPETIEDWDYMLPLFKEYFENLGLVEYAPLIIPYLGFFSFAELTDSYGVFPYNYYVDGKTVYYGPAQDGWREYVTKMNEWYKAGYIYQDFATRTQDFMFQPNPSLLYGNGAGIWMGVLSHLGDAMSDPESDVVYDVRPLKSPVAEGYTVTDQLRRNASRSDGSGTAYAITTKCENPAKLLSIIDYLYSDEGGMLTAYGLTKEQIPDSDTVYAANGLEEGAYWFDDNGNFVYNPLLDVAGGKLDSSCFNGSAFPGYVRNSFGNLMLSDEVRNAYDKWCGVDELTDKMQIPPLSSTDEEEAEMEAANPDNALYNYPMEMTTKFIIGTEPLDDESWNKHLEQLEAMGLSTVLKNLQAAYDRFLAR